MTLLPAAPIFRREDIAWTSAADAGSDLAFITFGRL
jgi:hypothetical protein